MQRMKPDCESVRVAGSLAKVAALAMLLMGWSARAMAQQPGQKTFSSAEEASNALVAAAQNNDEKTLLEILGPDAKQIVSSGDQAEDDAARANFVQKYREMHRLVTEPDGETTLYIGAENWPTPIPLMNKGNSWYFDTDTAKREILYRRVGQNELSAIRVCQELVAAEKEYHSAHGAYAPKIYSDHGQHNGLYWKAAAGEPKSPIGPLVAAAVAEGHAENRNAAPTPFRGYYYYIAADQGKSFAVVAYPAEYRSSGVMTFIADDSGVGYRKDLGKQTSLAAKALKEYPPDSSWQKDEDQQEQAAGK